MDFNVSTFLFEIVNFLILIWILQRLFYKPLLAVIAKRKAFIDQTMTDAKAMQQEAVELRERYENRQKLWEQEKQGALTALRQQLEAERVAHLNKLRNELEQERQKAKVTLTRQAVEMQQQAEKQALQNGVRFAAILLQEAATPELEARLCTLLLNNLETLPETCCANLGQIKTKKAIPIQIDSAYPLPDEFKHALEQKLRTLIEMPVTFHYAQDAQLIAGLRIAIDAWVLRANLQDELTGFAEIANESV